MNLNTSQIYLEVQQQVKRVARLMFENTRKTPQSCLEQFLFLVLLKVLDEEAQSNTEGKNLYPGNAERFRWSHWHDMEPDEMATYIGRQVFPYMSSLIKEDLLIADFFRDVQFELTLPLLLKEVIKTINTLFEGHLRQGRSEIVEFFLDSVPQDIGEYRTQRNIRSLMVQLANPHEKDSVLDPSCGTGGLLIDSLKHIGSNLCNNWAEVPIYGPHWLAKNNLSLESARSKFPELQTYQTCNVQEVFAQGGIEGSLFGTDISRNMVRISIVNLMLHGMSRPHINRDDSIPTSYKYEPVHGKKYDIILCDPPVGGQEQRHSIRSRDNEPVSRQNSEALFLEFAMDSLSFGGRCVFLIPDSILGSMRFIQNLRKRLVTSFNLLAVISLPTRPLKMSLLVFQNPSGSEEPATDKVWFSEIRYAGYEPQRTPNSSLVESLRKNDIPHLLSLWRQYESSNFTQIPGSEACAHLDHETEFSWWADYKLIAENGFNILPSRYKPIIHTKVEYENPVTLLKEVLKLEKEFVSDLKAFLKEIES